MLFVRPQSSEMATPEKDENLDIFVIERVFPDAHALFSWNIAPLESVCDQCDIVLATNVLLLPYGTSPNGLKEIKTVYEKLKNDKRLFVPAQVAREFARNRGTKLLEVHKALGDRPSRITLASSGSNGP